MFQSKFKLGSSALLCFAMLVHGDDSGNQPKDSGKEATEAYDALAKEFDEAVQKYLKGQDKPPQPAAFAKRFLEIATKYPKEDAAVDSLVWVAIRSGTSEETQTALDLLVKEHIDDPKLTKVCQSIIYNRGGPGSEQFLKTVFEKSKAHDAQGQACYGLALKAKERADVAKDRKGSEAEELGKEAEKLLEKVTADFADVKFFQGTLGEAAKGDLFEMRFLGVGMTAADIEGEDIDGEKMKLSDFKGKVVLLDFWGNW